MGIENMGAMRSNPFAKLGTEAKMPALGADAKSLVATSVQVDADRASIDKAMLEVDGMKAELTAVCQHLSSLKDGGALVSLKALENAEIKATELEQRIKAHQAGILEAERQLQG